MHHHQPYQVSDARARGGDAVSPGDLVSPESVRSGAGCHQLSASEHLSRLETLHLLQNVVTPVRAQEVIYDAGSELVEMLNNNIDSFQDPIPVTRTLHFQLNTFFPVFSCLSCLSLSWLAVLVTSLPPLPSLFISLYFTTYFVNVVQFKGLQAILYPAPLLVL